MKLRIKFKKYGAVRYIGHLDVMRFFQKAIRRAGIDVKYSNGFSPHQIMTFAAPLGVGIVSNGEYMDIEVHSLTCFPAGDDLSNGEGEALESCVSTETRCLEIRKRLNEASVPGIESVSVRILPDTAGNAMASVAAAAYTVGFREGKEPGTDIRAILPGFLARDRIPVTKKTKKGVREMDLKEGIFRLSCTEAPLCGGASADIAGRFSGSRDSSGVIGSLLAGKEPVVLSMLLDASSGGNIKPVQVVEALLAEQGEQLQENALWVVREDVYTNVGTETEPVLAPLDDSAAFHE